MKTSNGYEYYYNTLEDGKQVRNNLIYTSLINANKTIFCQWYYHDSDYHKGKNEAVDPALVQEKWEREVEFLELVYSQEPQICPKLLEIDKPNQKIMLEVQGPDLWQQTIDHNCNYADILPDWEDQMLNILQIYKKLGIRKMSLHPSSYFINNGKLQAINYFFTYYANEPKICMQQLLSHISLKRQEYMKNNTQHLGIDWNKYYDINTIQILAIESFSDMYPQSFIDHAKQIFI